MKTSVHCNVCKNTAPIGLLVQCGCCHSWFHPSCTGIAKSELLSLISFHCNSCAKENGPSEYKRRLKRSRANIDYVALNEGETFAVDKSIHPHVPKFHEFGVNANDYDAKANPYVDIVDELKMEEVLATHLKKPMMVPCGNNDSGMMLPVPRELLTIDYILEKVGHDAPVEVMDVLSQQGVSPRWNMKQWRDYFVTDKEVRDRIRNVISLEISQVEELGVSFKRPHIVNTMDLIDKTWVDDSDRPQVTKYCLMSVSGSFTDFHIDFGGTSVYYTVCKGSKTFLMFPPSETNLSLYNSWCQEQNQNFMWFAEYSKTIKGKSQTPSNGFKVTLSPGDLFIIPSGWIHAVYTPDDSIVIGGNFLTMMNMKTQLDIYGIEKDTKVPMKFRHPQFNKVLWLASWYYYNHPEDFVADIGAVKPVKLETGSVKLENASVNAADSQDPVHPKNVLTCLYRHLQDHYNLSQTNQTAKKSVPVLVIGKDVTSYLEALREWSMSF